MLVRGGETELYHESHGSDGYGSFTITVQDTMAPSLDLPTDKTVEATKPAGVDVSYPASASDIVDGNVSVNCVPASGSTFALTTTTVTCSASDAHGNSAGGTFRVTVEDTTPPQVAVPTDLTGEAMSSSGRQVTFAAFATDVVDGSIVPSCSLASEAWFSLGTTSVTCSASDSHGNTGTRCLLLPLSPGPSGSQPQPLAAQLQIAKKDLIHSNHVHRPFVVPNVWPWNVEAAGMEVPCAKGSAVVNSS